jgi:hypothetical protein
MRFIDRDRPQLWRARCGGGCVGSSDSGQAKAQAEETCHGEERRQTKRTADEARRHAEAKANEARGREEEARRAGARAGADGRSETRPATFDPYEVLRISRLGKWESDWVLPGPAPDQAWQSWSETRRRVFRADAQDDYADIGALEVSAYTPQRGTFGKDSAVVNRRIRKDGITTIENIQLSIAKSAYNQAEFVTLFVRGSDGQWSVGVARFKRVR